MYIFIANLLKYMQDLCDYAGFAKYAENRIIA